jgi:general secretion pathway protein N
MKRTIWIAVLAVLAFAVIVVTRLPAQWAAGVLPQGVSCVQLSGSVWNGACGNLTVRGLQLGDVVWQVHPAPLLTGKLAMRIDMSRGADFARGEIEADRGGTISARDLQASLPLERALIPQLPANLSGNVRTDLSVLRVEKGVVTTVQGHIEARDLEQHGRTSLRLGDYVVSFPVMKDGTEPVGELRSVSGPLDVQGTLRLTREPGFVVEGLVSPHPDAPPDLVEQLRFLGAADAQGRRPFSVAGTF